MYLWSVRPNLGAWLCPPVALPVPWFAISRVSVHASSAVECHALCTVNSCYCCCDRMTTWQPGLRWQTMNWSNTLGLTTSLTRRRLRSPAGLDRLERPTRPMIIRQCCPLSTHSSISSSSGSSSSHNEFSQNTAIRWTTTTASTSTSRLNQRRTVRTRSSSRVLG